MRRLYAWLGVLALLGCTAREPAPLFEQLPAARTGIGFANALRADTVLSVLNYEYFYNGGGVAVGDLDNDGLADVFFTGNQVSCRLYRNLGNFRFEDVTEKAGVATTAWAGGVTLADVNADGWLDVYVSCTGHPEPARRRNLLFINNHDFTFTEAAARYGIADEGYTTQSAFLDYDRDGDLDLYLLCHANEQREANLIVPARRDGRGPSTDKLYRNNGNGTFTDVSAAAGITVEGYGLGIVVTDVNGDAWPDFYVANDYVYDDLLYLNNRDGTFAERGKQYLGHTSQFAMGVDAGDINNDGLPDLMVADMLPADNRRQKLLGGTMNYNRYHLTLEKGYNSQYMRNTLQLNTGTGRFAEIGQYAGVHQTDWSWAVLLADYDNDGWKDLFVANGYAKNITDKDFALYAFQYRRGRLGEPAERRLLVAAIDSLAGARVPNYLFRNNGDLSFTDQSRQWGMRTPSYSNGAAYGDLDNDGDLDLVINNLDAPAFVYRNNQPRGPGKEYLRLRLAGDSLNPFAVGATVKVQTVEGKTLLGELNPSRGYQSSVEPVLHFGLGTQTVRQVEITWPDGTAQVVENVRPNQLLEVRKSPAARPAVAEPPAPPLFRELGESLGIRYRHREEEYVDFNVQVLLPHQYSRLGPGVAAGDVNGDGLDDFYVGGAAGSTGRLFVQDRNGTFEGRPVAEAGPHEDAGVLLFDADGDRDLDLYLASGGSEYLPGTPYYGDRLYTNDGTGQFTHAPRALPPLYTSSSVVTAADYDRDGDLDLFVGGRVYPSRYPLPAESYLLENERGVFRDVTARRCPGLKRLGLVTAALWSDFDGDGRVDLVLAGEWMPVTFLRNDDGRFTGEDQPEALREQTGWWNSLAGGDFDNDGDTDYLAGNLGLNTSLKASPEEPVLLYTKDFDANGTLDPVLCRYTGGQPYPVAGRELLLEQLPALRKRFPNYRTYAQAPFETIFPPDELEKAYVLRATQFRSCYLENRGEGAFVVRPLPPEAQLAPVFGIVVRDVDGDGRLDALLAGNSFSGEVITGRYDAFRGLYLKGGGDGTFTAVPSVRSGLRVAGDAKGMADVRGPGDRLLTVVAQNDDSLKVFGYTRPAACRRVPLEPDDWYAEVTRRGGGRRRVEFTYGSGYLSQSSRFLELLPGEPTGAVRITKYHGQSRFLGNNPNFYTNYAKE